MHMKEISLTMNKHKPLPFLFYMLVLPSLLFGQISEERCASDLLHQELLETNEEYRHQYTINEAQIHVYVRDNAGSNQTQRAVVTIPTVVHIVHTGEALGVGSNISDAQIQSAIAGLNEDFRRMIGTNGAGNGVDTEIEFCLAQRDPNDLTTTGIVRVDATGVGCSSGNCYETVGIQTGSGGNEVAIKNTSPAWPNTKYYNIWIVSEINGNNGGSGIQGFAYFPGAPANIDGAVILYNQFGTIGNLSANSSANRVTTHEVGHSFNLLHTFHGDNGGVCPINTDCQVNGDQVCDTPPHIRSLSGTCDIFGTNPCDGNSSNELFVHNYMNYSDGLCMNMFTQGQKDRMQACLTGPRSTLLSSNGCDPPCENLIASFSADQTVFEIGSGFPTPVVNLTNSSSGAVSYNWLIDGTSFATSTDAQYTFTAEGEYSICLEATDATGCIEIFCLPITINGPGECVNPPTEFVNGNFSTPANIGSTSFNDINNNLLGWNVSHGSPSTSPDISSGSNRAMWIWSYCSSGCPNFNSVRGEGVFNCF